MFSSADKCGKRWKPWKTIPTRARSGRSARAWAGVPGAMVSPATSSAPVLNGCSPFRQRKKVLLPPPLGPTSAIVSPCATCASNTASHQPRAEPLLQRRRL